VPPTSGGLKCSKKRGKENPLDKPFAIEAPESVI